jgi:8-oxo-dGTP diphosphatase
MAFDHESVTGSAVERLRSKLSYTNLGFALAPAEFTMSQLREVYAAALGHDVGATNLQRDPDPARAARADRAAGGTDPQGRTPRHRVPLRLASPGDHRPVRGPAPRRRHSPRWR